MIEVAEAAERILASMPDFGTARRPIAGSFDLVLAEDAVAERDQPPFDRVTMDGIAIRHADWSTGQKRFRRIGVQAAGAPALSLDQAGQCIEIMTGAMLPNGADTIVPVERLHEDGAYLCIHPEAPIEHGQFIHTRGSDGRRGDTLLAAGARLGAPQIAVLASAGYSEVQVAGVPRIAIISTGDELASPGSDIEPHQIRSSNDLAIGAMLERRRLAEVTRVLIQDDEAALLDAVEKLHTEHAALILSGGVSMGKFDFVPAVLERLGAKVVFHKIRQKPGRPMWFGLSAAAKPIFALPGNPVSALVCTRRYVVPALEAAAKARLEAPELVTLSEATSAPPNLTYFLPVKTHWTESGAGLAQPCPTNTSGDFVSLANTDGFVELPRGHAAHAAGTVATLYRW